MSYQTPEELDDLELDDLEDFESSDFDLPTQRASSDYIGSMWDRWGFDRARQSGADADAILIAHGMVTSFLNAFARDGGRYEVFFDPKMRTAGTNMNTRRTVITPAPLLDPNLTPRQAGEVLTGLAVHEVCHPRYGRDTSNAIGTVFKGNAVAHNLSNLLEDVRIERRFVEDYPGYSGVFDAPMKYVTASIVKRLGGNMKPDWDKLHEVAGAAVRYPSITDWDGFEEERDWWQDWANRWSREDSPRKHVEAIREAMKHIVATKIRRELEEQQRREEEERRREEEEAARSELEAQQESAAREVGEADEDDDGEEADESGDAPDDSAGSGASEESSDEDEDSDADEEEDGSGTGELEDDDYVPDELKDQADQADEDGEPDEYQKSLDYDDDGPTSDDDDDDGPAPADQEDEPIDADGLDGDAEDEDESSGLDERADAAADEMGDEELADAVDDDDTGMNDDLPTCAGSGAVEEAAVSQGVDQQEIDELREEAQTAIQQAESYESDGHGGKVDVARSMKGLIHGRLNRRYSRYFKKSDLASRFIRDALIQSRSGHTETSHYQKRGRLDQQSLHRITKMDYRLFDRKKAPSPGRYNIWIMLDRSGSMDGTPSLQQAQVATAIADATRHVKTVRAAVWAWSNNFRSPDSWEPGVALAWRTGQPTADIARTIDLGSGGTPDAAILGWATDAILRESRLGEQPVILFCSDGWGDSRLGERVAEARKKGILVASVAFGQLDRDSQEARFGRDGFVAWDGDIIRTARPLAKLIARIVGHDRRR